MPAPAGRTGRSHRGAEQHDRREDAEDRFHGFTFLLSSLMP
jgi:hypothetical protein